MLGSATFLNSTHLESVMASQRDRREFLKKSSAIVAASAMTTGIARHAHAAGSDEIRFCVVGCGGRGTGARKKRES